MLVKIEKKYDELKEKLKYDKIEVKCACCEKHLANLFVIPSIEKYNEYIFKCICGEQSFKIKCDGKTFIESNFNILKCETNNNLTTVYLGD